MAKKIANPGEPWHLPDKRRKRPLYTYNTKPFAYSTPAEAQLLRFIAEDGHTWASALEVLSRYSPTERAIAQRFVDAGYGDDPMSLHMLTDGRARKTLDAINALIDLAKQVA